MRSLALAAAAALVVVLALPSQASASPSAALEIGGPDAAADGRPVELNVTLALQDFACPRDSAFDVSLSTETSGAAQALLSGDHLTFSVPAGSYVFFPYAGQQGLGIIVSGTGSTRVTATFESAGGDCIAVGGFPTTSASFTIKSGEPAPPATDGNSTTSDATAPPTNGTDPPSAVDRLPPGGGHVGDYKPPAESSSMVPGPGLLLVGAAIAAAAWGVRRRR